MIGLRELVNGPPLRSFAAVKLLGGRRTALAYHDGKVFSEWRDVVGRMTLVGEPYRENTNDWIVARYWYDDAGRRTTTVRGAGLDGTTTGFSYDAASRLTSIAHNLNGTADDLTLGFSYNPAGQIVSNSRSNDLYTLGSATGTATEVPNGRNQLAERNGATLLYDRRGNLTDDGAGRTYAYDSDNRLVSSTAGGVLTTLTYDPLGRLYSLTSGGTTRRFAYDGHTLLSEHDGATQALLRRFVHGPGVDGGRPTMRATRSAFRTAPTPTRTSAAASSPPPPLMAPASRSTATTSTASRRRRSPAASATPARCGSRSSASPTTAPAYTTPSSAASCRRTPSATTTGRTCTPMSAAIR